MDNAKMMKVISDKLGREKAVEMVLQAYNTELITTWIARIEANKPLGGPQRRDHLTNAISRVLEVCELAP
jgi:hypothetical protein